MFFYIFALSIGQASQIITGHLVGAGEYDKAYRQGLRSYSYAFIISAAACAIGIILRYQLIGIFTGNAEVIELGANILLLNAFLEAGRTTNLIIIACLRGSGDVYFPTACAVFSNWTLSVGGSYLLAVVCGMGIYGLWIALAADECFRGILMLLRWKSGKWRNKSIVKHSET
jgi:Na+-driven multidrug efflux pump